MSRKNEMKTTGIWKAVIDLEYYNRWKFTAEIFYFGWKILRWRENYV